MANDVLSPADAVALLRGSKSKEQQELSPQDATDFLRGIAPPEPSSVGQALGSSALEGMSALPTEVGILAGDNMVGRGAAALGEHFRQGAEALDPMEGRGQGGLVEDLARAGGSIIGAAPAMMLGPTAAAAQFGAQSGVPLYFDILESTGDEKAALIGLLGGNALGQLEQFGAEGVLTKLAGKLAGKEAGKAVVREMAKRALGVAGAGLAEATTEVAQQAGSDAILEALTDEDVDNLGNMLRSIPPALILGSGLKGFSEIVDEGLARRQQRQQAKAEVSPETPQPAPQEPQATGTTGEIKLESDLPLEGSQAAQEPTGGKTVAQVSEEGPLQTPQEAPGAKQAQEAPEVTQEPKPSQGAITSDPFKAFARKLDEKSITSRILDDINYQLVRLHSLQAPEFTQEPKPSQEAGEDVSVDMAERLKSPEKFQWFRGHKKGFPTGETETFLGATQGQASPFARQVGGEVSEVRFKRKPNIYPSEIPWGEYQKHWRNSALLSGYDAVPIIEPNGQDTSLAVRNPDILEFKPSQEAAQRVSEPEAPLEPKKLPEDIPVEQAVREPETEKKLHAFAGPIDWADLKADAKTVFTRLLARKKNAESDPLLGDRSTLVIEREIFDKLAAVRRTVETAKAKGTVSEAQDVELNERLRRGVTGSRLKRADRTLLQPIKDLLTRSKIEQEQDIDVENHLHTPEDPGARLFLLARATEDGNLSIRVKGGEGTRGGLTDAEAKQILKGVQSGPKAAEYAELAKKFDKINKATRETWVEGGLETQEFVDMLAEEFPTYAPARTDLDNEVPYRTGRGVSIQGPESKAALGRKTLADNPLAFALIQNQRAIVRAEKNKAADSLRQLVEGNPELFDGVAKVVKSRSKRALVNGEVRWTNDPTLLKDPNAVGVKVKGEQWYVLFDEKYGEIARALNNADGAEVGSITKFLDAVIKETGGLTGLAAKGGKAIISGQATRAVAGLATRYNPAFPLRNILRDFQTSQLLAQEHGAEFAKAVRGNTKNAAKALARSKKKDPSTTKDPEWDSWVRRYEDSGAPITYLDLDDVASIEKKMREDLSAAGPGAAKKVRRGWRQMVQLLGDFNDVAENSIRLAGFRAAVEKLGYSDKKAALFAKEMTVNFETKGNLSQVVNALYMFTTASIGGSRRIITGLLKSQRVRRLLYKAAAGMMVWDQVARAMMGEDDDGEMLWDKIPEHVKANNFVYPKPWTDKDNDYGKIPMAYGIGFFLYTAQELSATLSGNEDPSDAIGDIASALFDQFNPLGGSEDVVQTLTPTVLKPAVEISQNKDWAGRPIAPTRYPGNTKPDAYQHWPDVNPLARGAAQTLGRLTGGSEEEPGMVDVSPESIEHWTKFVGGGLFREVARAWTGAEKWRKGEKVEYYDIPLYSIFNGEITEHQRKKARAD